MNTWFKNVTSFTYYLTPIGWLQFKYAAVLYKIVSDTFVSISIINLMQQLEVLPGMIDLFSFL